MYLINNLSFLLIQFFFLFFYLFFLVHLLLEILYHFLFLLSIQILFLFI